MWTNDKEETGNHCKAKNDGEEVKAEEKKEEKCAGKLEDICKKETGCKWDGKERKDFSFLNRKFALSMASAFVSLISFYNFKYI